MADIAAIFHWPLDSMERMTLNELASWRERAAKRTGNHEQ